MLDKNEKRSKEDFETLDQFCIDGKYVKIDDILKIAKPDDVLVIRNEQGIIIYNALVKQRHMDIFYDLYVKWCKCCYSVTPDFAEFELMVCDLVRFESMKCDYITEKDEIPFDMVDMVNHPKHYIQGGLETIDVIAAFTQGLEGIEAVCTANAIKYICRWKNKNGVEDLKKAQWYINHLIEELEGSEGEDKNERYRN